MHPNFDPASAALGRRASARLFAAAALAFLVVTMTPAPAQGDSVKILFTPANRSVEEGSPAFKEQWVLENISGSPLDILWRNNNDPYLSIGTGGIDNPKDVPLLNWVVLINGVKTTPIFTGTDWISVVPKGGTYTISFTVDPTLDGKNDGPPWDSGNASISWTLYYKKDGTALWSEPFPNGPYKYTAEDKPLKGPPPVPEPSSLLLMGTGVLGLAAMVRRKLRM